MHKINYIQTNIQHICNIGWYSEKMEKPLNFDPFGHARFAHLFVLYD